MAVASATYRNQESAPLSRSFPILSDCFRTSVSQKDSSIGLDPMWLRDCSLSPFSFRGGRSRSAVNNSTDCRHTILHTSLTVQ